MGTQNLWSYREHLYRIIEESLEVSLVICNAELSEFTVAKIFDIFNQVLSTGFVLNTGYWPFFNSLKKQSICVCGRYGLDCRHFKHDYHWIDLESLPSDQTMLFSTTLGNLILLNSEVDLTPITGGAAGYALNIKLTFQYKKIERGRPKRKKNEKFNINPDNLLHVVICSRYSLQREYYPALHTIMFQPSPFFYETYGSYFPKLLQAREALIQFPTEINHTFHAVSLESMPHFTLILQYVNMPVHQYTKSATDAIFSHLDPPKVKKTSYCKATQTEHNESAEVWKYQELIGNLKPLWNDSISSSCESLFVNNSGSSNMFYGSYIVNNDHNVVSSQCSITEIPSSTDTDSIKSDMININGMNSMIKKGTREGFALKPPTTSTQDQEYDAQWPQWGYQKVVAKKRGRKKILRNTVVEPKRKLKTLATDNKNTLQKSNNSRSISLPTYATVLKSPKPPQLSIEYNVENNDSKLEPFKYNPSLSWSDNQFPDLLNNAAIKMEYFDEDFDIAEEFIKQEKEREDIRWRLNQIQ